MTAGSGRSEPVLVRLKHWCRRMTAAGRRADADSREEVPQMSQPLASIVDALRGLHRRRQELDTSELSGDGLEERDQIAAQREEQLEAIDHLEQAMAYVEPDHLREATVQVLIAANRIDNLQEQAEEVALSRELETVRRLLRRAAPVLAQAAEIDLKSFDTRDHL